MSPWPQDSAPLKASWQWLRRVEPKRGVFSCSLSLSSSLSGSCLVFIFPLNTQRSWSS